MLIINMMISKQAQCTLVQNGTPIFGIYHIKSRFQYLTLIRVWHRNTLYNVRIIQQFQVIMVDNLRISYVNADQHSFTNARHYLQIISKCQTGILIIVETYIKVKLKRPSHK